MLGLGRRTGAITYYRQPAPLLQAAHTTITGSPHHYYCDLMLGLGRRTGWSFSYGLYTHGPRSCGPRSYGPRSRTGWLYSCGPRSSSVAPCRPKTNSDPPDLRPAVVVTMVRAITKMSRWSAPRLGRSHTGRRGPGPRLVVCLWPMRLWPMRSWPT